MCHLSNSSYAITDMTKRNKILHVQMVNIFRQQIVKYILLLR